MTDGRTQTGSSGLYRASIASRGKNTTQHSTMSLADSGGVRIGTGNLFVGPYETDNVAIIGLYVQYWPQTLTSGRQHC